MSRGKIHVWRPLAVWLFATSALLGAAAATPGAWDAAASSSTTVADLLVAVCTTALTGALGWLWLVTTVTVVELLAGRVRSDGGVTRRLVLAACGAAVVAGTSVPAVAAGGDTAGHELLAGLPLPERAVARADRPRHDPAPTAARPAGLVAERYVVRPGDSLWTVAQAHPGSGSDTDRRWREIWQANRDVVGDDPDLILPGQALRLPGPSLTDSHPDSHDDTDGARR